jgi:hypothetical protein
VSIDVLAQIEAAGGDMVERSKIREPMPDSQQRQVGVPEE